MSRIFEIDEMNENDLTDDYSGWWVLLLFLVMSQEPEFSLPSMVETVYECPDCGQRYLDDPYCIPNHCDRCGGVYVEKVVKRTIYMRNDDGSIETVTKEYE